MLYWFHLYGLRRAAMNAKKAKITNEKFLTRKLHNPMCERRCLIINTTGFVWNSVWKSMLYLSYIRIYYVTLTSGRSRTVCYVVYYINHPPKNIYVIQTANRYWCYIFLSNFKFSVFCTENLDIDTISFTKLYILIWIINVIITPIWNKERQQYAFMLREHNTVS